MMDANPYAAPRSGRVSGDRQRRVSAKRIFVIATWLFASGTILIFAAKLYLIWRLSAISADPPRAADADSFDVIDQSISVLGIAAAAASLTSITAIGLMVRAGFAILTERRKPLARNLAESECAPPG